MLLVTTETIAGKNIKEVLGIVQGTIVQSKHIGKDIMASFKTIVGGEIKGYSQMVTEARQKATERMIAQAEELKADAIVGIRYTSSSVVQGASEILVYGTAVKLK